MKPQSPAVLTPYARTREGRHLRREGEIWVAPRRQDREAMRRMRNVVDTKAMETVAVYETAGAQRCAAMVAPLASRRVGAALR